MIYLDHNATTPLDPRVLEQMLPYLTTTQGNASSVHASGQRARRAIDDAREQVASALGCAPKEIVFTSGGTEADNLALRGVFAARKATHTRIVTTSLEHPAVLDTVRALDSEGAETIELPVSHDGELIWAALEQAVTDATALVSVMWANNETGVLFPIERLGALCRERNVPLHVDAVQAAGKVRIDLRKLPIDLLSISSHKLYGPKGAGALFVRKGSPLWSVQTGGHQESGRRGGTENVPAIVGFGAAMALVNDCFDDNARCARLRDRLESAIVERIPETRVIGAGAPRVDNTATICFRHVEGEALLMALDLAGICVSSGSACTAGSLEPSHVLRAMGFTADWARGAVRFSFGRGNTDDDIDKVVSILPDIVSRLRSAS